MTATTTAAPPALLTAEEFMARYDGQAAELLDGQVVTLMPGGVKHGDVCGNAYLLIGGFVKAGRLGVVCCNDTAVVTRRDPDRVRGGDVVFWSLARWPSGERPAGLIPVPPSLVVEVKSPNDRRGEIRTKVGEYESVGVDVVVVLDPDLEVATAYRGEELPQRFHNGDEFTLPDVLPGFAVPVARFFE